MTISLRNTIIIAICYIVILVNVIILSKGMFTPKVGVAEKVTDAQVTDIYNNLWKYAGITDQPNFVISESADINAYANFSTHTITITRGMLDFIDNRDQIAAVLGHEIGHILLEHDVLNPLGENNHEVILEGNADKFGIYLMLRADYNICEANKLWLKLREMNGDYETNESHPNFSYRAWELTFPQCSL